MREEYVSLYIFKMTIIIMMMVVLIIGIIII